MLCNLLYLIILKLELRCDQEVQTWANPLKNPAKD